MSDAACGGTSDVGTTNPEEEEYVDEGEEDEERQSRKRITKKSGMVTSHVP
jgi:hypothetical protein